MVVVVEGTILLGMMAYSSKDDETAKLPGALSESAIHVHHSDL